MIIHVLYCKDAYYVEERTHKPDRIRGLSHQGELVSALKSVGYDVNQASVSRELKAKEVHKVDGFYVLENGSLPPSVPVTDAHATASGPMVVLKHARLRTHARAIH